MPKASELLCLATVGWILLATAQAKPLLLIEQDVDHPVPMNWIQPDPLRQHLAYVQWNDVGGRYRIFLKNILSNKAGISLASTGNHAFAPVWSADGRQLAYITGDADRQLFPEKQIWLYDLKTHSSKLISAASRCYMNLSFSQDGKELFATVYSGGRLDQTEHQSKIYALALTGTPNETLLLEDTGYIPQVWDVGIPGKLFYLLFQAPNWPYGTGWFLVRSSRSVRALPIRLEPSDYSGAQLLLTGMQSHWDSASQSLWLGTGKQVFLFKPRLEQWQRVTAATRFVPLREQNAVFLSSQQKLYVMQGAAPAEELTKAPRGELLWYQPGNLGLYVPTSTRPEIQVWHKELVVGKQVSKDWLLVDIGLLALLMILLAWRFRIIVIKSKSGQAAADKKFTASPLERLSEKESTPPPVPTETPAPDPLAPKRSLSDRIKKLRAPDPPHGV